MTNPNGTCKIAPILKSEVDWYPERQKNVIAIDFGTLTLAVAYKLADGGVHTIPIQDAYQYDYIPTVLLIDMSEPDEASRVEIGHRALQRYCDLDVDVEKHDCIFFNQVKLELQNDEVS